MMQKTPFLTLFSLGLALFLSLPGSLFAQPPGFGGRGGQMNTGRFYGKIVDENGKGVAYAAVQLHVMGVDTLTKTRTSNLVAGQITAENGDFSLENLPARGKFQLKISLLGYAKIEQEVSFGQSGGGANFDKDLGNIVLSSEATTLDEVVIEGEASSMTLALDKRVFRVDKNLNSVGGTAEDALKNVPSLSVDIDGNLTLRNASPQLFVDGRPTTLTLDQIPSDAIESVEVITNPSAKYDASGGQAGIVNIVMKKNRRIGYNGNLRVGTDTRKGYNFGGNINVREGKVNAFLSANLNNRVSVGEGETVRNNLFGSPLTNVIQETEDRFTGTFANLRGGLDWFVDNRNTFTFSGSYTRGQFKPMNMLLTTTDSLFESGTTSSESIRTSETERGFRNVGGSILFKHLYPKDGREWTADANYNAVSVDGFALYETEFMNSGKGSRERQETGGGTRFFTAQTDYVDPLTKNIKLEAGARAAIRSFDNFNASFLYSELQSEYLRIPSFADTYQFDDQVYAVYGTLTHQFSRWGYMAGLRVESSQYTGVLPDADTTFENDYPFSFFPSAFATYKLNEEDNLQFSYTRRINRPNFFQLMPFTDFTDSLNLRRGNADLLPEFTNSFEMSYMNILGEGNSLLATAYFKEATDLITTYQFTEFYNGKEVVVSSYINSNRSQAYGVEVTLQNRIGKVVELSTNVNVYNSRVDASNIETDLVINQFSWLFKENINIKLPADFRLQLSGEYKSRAAFDPNGNSGRWGGWGGGVTNTAQGYSLPVWFVDASVRKDLFKRKVSLTVSVNDIFASRRSGSYSESALFIQDSWRIRNPQMVRVNLSYRFGKPDASLFKRKNTNVNMNGSDMM